MTDPINASNYINHNIKGGYIAGGDINRYGIFLEKFTALAEELGVTKTALNTFFKILNQEKVTFENYDHTLRQIAECYQSLVQELAASQSHDPTVKALITEAEKHLKQDAFDQAEALINQASDKDQ